MLQTGLRVRGLDFFWTKQNWKLYLISWPRVLQLLKGSQSMTEPVQISYLQKTLGLQHCLAPQINSYCAVLLTSIDIAIVTLR